MSFDFDRENRNIVFFMLVSDQRVRQDAVDAVEAIDHELLERSTKDVRRPRQRDALYEILEASWSTASQAVVTRWKELYPNQDPKDWFPLNNGDVPSNQPTRAQLAGLVGNLRVSETYHAAILAEYPEVGEHLESFKDNPQCKCRGAIRNAIGPRWIRWYEIAKSVGTAEGIDLFEAPPAEGGQTRQQNNRRKGTDIGGTVVTIDDTDEAWAQLVQQYKSEGKYWSSHDVVPISGGKVKVYFA